MNDDHCALHGSRSKHAEELTMGDIIKAAFDAVKLILAAEDQSEAHRIAQALEVIAAAERDDDAAVRTMHAAWSAHVAQRWPGA